MAVNDLKVDKDIKMSIFADDTAIWKSGTNLKFLENRMQKALDDISDWCNMWGFKISIEKTQVIVFAKKKHSGVNLKYKDNCLKTVKKVKFLGMIFDSKLTWKDHITFIVDKCQMRINLLRCITRSHWGSGKDTLSYIYKALIRSRIDYGSEIYNSAGNFLLHKLTVVQNKCLRICTGAYRVTSVAAMEVDCGVMPLDIRRNMLQAKLAVGYLALLNSPVSSCFRKSWHSTFSKYTNAKTIFDKVMEFVDISVFEVDKFSEMSFPPWQVFTPLVDISLHEVISKQDPDLWNKLLGLDFIETWGDHLHIYTDGSKSEEGCTAAYYIPEFEISKGFRLSNHCNNFEAELVAILQALQWIIDKGIRRTVIFSDSLSGLQAIIAGKFGKSVILKEIHYLLFIIQSRNLIVSLAWIPSHVGIQGNEKVDKLAKEALDFNQIGHFKIPYTDLKPQINTQARAHWQAIWDAETENKLHSIQPLVDPQLHCCGLDRREEVVLARARIGHTYLTHSYLLKGEPMPECIPCQCPLTVKHILIECIDFSHIRPQCFNVQTLEDLFTDVPSSKILLFLKDINLFYSF